MEPSLNPQSITVDFEKAMLNAISVQFPGASVKGCFFHFTQCIFRAVQNHGFKLRYETDPEFALRIRMLSAIAFVPPNFVVEVFEELCDGILPIEAQAVIDYFEDTWIGCPHRRQRRPPKYAWETWNIYSRTTDVLPRTINSVEGWHRGFESQAGATHLNIWKFINCLKKEQALNEVRIEQFLAGFQAPLPKKKYRNCCARLLNIVSNFNRENIIEYIRAVSHNLSF